MEKQEREGTLAEIEQCRVGKVRETGGSVISFSLLLRFLFFQKETTPQTTVQTEGPVVVFIIYCYKFAMPVFVSITFCV